MLQFVVSAKSITMEEKELRRSKPCLECKQIRDIQMFLKFAHFFPRFIQEFSAENNKQ